MFCCVVFGVWRCRRWRGGGFFFSSRRRHTRWTGDWSSDVCSSDLPGSFCPNARDAFDEGILIPPIKIVERGELRRDIEGVYLRASRKPYLVALDLRAQIAGNTAAKNRILGLIRRYGADVVK